MDDYPLSLKDTSGLDYIPELEAMGIACAAVGRGMKRPEQLAKLTEVCVKCARDSRKPTAGYESGNGRMPFRRLWMANKCLWCI